MGRKTESLQHALIRQVEERKNNLTSKSYRKSVKKFVAWAKENGYRKPEQLTKDVIQKYEKALEQDSKCYKPATIHTFLAPVCDALEVPMEQIWKPRRTAGTISRGRDRDAEGNKIEKNRQGREQEKDPKYARLVKGQHAIGIRRAELKKLEGADLINEEEDWYVRVKRGKGGKAQMQFILPDDVPTVCRIFEDIAPDQKVFSENEMNNKINLHGLRAQHAQDCYFYYINMIERDPSAAAKLRAKLLSRWDEGNERLKNSNFEKWKKQRERFVAEMDDRPYLLRGENLRKAQALGVPDRYNRLALMCVSVMHLSHWRLDVTVINYLVR